MRLFVALETPDAIRTELVDALAHFKRLSDFGVNWVKPENLHLTVNFIGEIPDHRVNSVAAIVEAQAKKSSPFVLRAEGYELFPAKHPKVIWARFTGNEKDIRLLNKQLVSSLSDLGLDPDIKDLKLHVTLGRIKDQQSVHFEREVMAFPIGKEDHRWDTVTLYRSTLKPEGPVYTILNQYYL